MVGETHFVATTDDGKVRAGYIGNHPRDIEGIKKILRKLEPNERPYELKDLTKIIQEHKLPFSICVGPGPKYTGEEE